MTLIEKIKQSVEGATGMPFLYHAAGEINELIARCKSLPVAYSFLINSGTIEDVNGRHHEHATLAVMFTDKTEFDFNALENEEIIDRMKLKAYKWLDSLRNSNYLQIVSVNSTQRLYDTTTDVLTGFAVNITIKDVAGVGECELPEVVIDVDKNGSYNVVGVDKVRVNVMPKLEELEVTKNGEYLPANYDADGFSKVTAQVVPIMRVMLPNDIKISNELIIDGYWAGELVDTSQMTSMWQMFRSCSQLQSVDVSGWDVSKVTKTGLMFYGCSKLQHIDVSNWDTSNFVSIDAMFQDCTQLQSLDVSNWDTSSVTNIGGMFYQCFQLQNLDVSNWNTSSVTNMSGVFYRCKKLQNIDVSDWNTSSVTNMGGMFAVCTQLQSLDVSNWNVGSVTNMSEMFSGCTQLQSLDVSNWNVGSVTDMWQLFRNCYQFQSLDLSNWDVSKVTRTGLMFDMCSKLQTLIDNRTINDVLMDNISALKGLKVSLSLNHTILDRASIRALINGLADLTGQTAQTLTLGATLMAKLTEEDIAIAVNKNWTIV